MTLVKSMAKTIDRRNNTPERLQQRKTALLLRMRVPAQAVRASFVRQFLTCGKRNCRCRHGAKHGPFFYLVRCDAAGRVRKFLLKTPAQRQTARTAIAAHRKFQRQLAELSEINAELLRRGIAEA